jgi:uncharacterized protein (TIGR03437 family)
MNTFKLGRILLQFAIVAVSSHSYGAQPSPPAGYTITTIAGNNSAGFSGDGSAATSAQISGPWGIAVDSSGNIYFADQFNHRIRKIDTSGNISTVAGKGTSGFSGDGGSATSAELASPVGVAVDSSGNLYIADTGNNRIRKVSGGNISTIAGTDTAGFSGDGGAATSAQLKTPVGIVVDSSGNIYFSDSGNNRIRKITTDGNINTIAGNGSSGSAGDGGPATSARLKGPRGLALDSAGNLYIADADNSRIRRVATDGTITTVAGNGTAGFAGDGGPATQASLNGARSVAVDGAGNLYISDYYNSRVRKITANGTILTIAGNGLFAFSGDGGPGTEATLNFPLGVAVGSGGKVFIADTGNNVIRQLSPQLSGPPTINANGVVSASAFGAFNSVAPGSWIEIYGSNLSANTRSWTAADFNGNSAPAALDGTTVTIGGQAAAISYISPTQVNVQVPSTVGTGMQQVTVSTAAGTSAAYTVTVNPTQPGLLAPAAFKVNGQQYAGATFPDGVTFVAPAGAIPGVNSRPAKPGETIILYGVGFGAVTPDIPAGQIVQQQNTLSLPFQVTFGETAATLVYDGLAPNAVGLYQFNVVVPNVANSDAVPLKFSLGGVLGTQTLYVAVHD